MATHTNCQNYGVKKAVIKQLSRESSEIWKSCVYCNYCTLHKERNIPLLTIAAKYHAREPRLLPHYLIFFSCAILCLTAQGPSFFRFFIVWSKFREKLEVISNIISFSRTVNTHFMLLTCCPSFKSRTVDTKIHRVRISLLKHVHRKSKDNGNSYFTRHTNNSFSCILT